MRRKASLCHMARAALVLLLMAGCGAPAATPVSAEVVPATFTAEPRAPTPTAEPQASTLTPIPPTVTPTSSPEAAPPTLEPTATTLTPDTATARAPTPTSEAPAPTQAPVLAPTQSSALAISSAAFHPDGEIPRVHSCQGDNVSPALLWSGVPAETQSFLLLVYDLDAGSESGASTPQGFAHWIVFDIPPSGRGYEGDMPAGNTLSDGAKQGSNDFAQFASRGDPFPGGAPIKVVGYDGPCPGARHRYAFSIYALDTLLGLPAAATMAQVLGAMKGHILAEAQLVGSYAPAQ